MKRLCLIHQGHTNMVEKFFEVKMIRMININMVLHVEVVSDV